MAQKLTIRAYSPTDPLRIDARADFAREHALIGEPLFGPERVQGPCWTLTDGPRRWAKPLACGGLEPNGHGRFTAWLYASDMPVRGWVMVRRAFRAMVIETGARRVEVTVRADASPKSDRFAEADLGLKFEGVLRGFGPDGADYSLYAGVY
jgi:hypothetical protein